MSIADFVVYETATGKILRVGKCPPSDALLQSRADQTVMQGVADLKTQKVDVATGNIVPIS